MLMQNCKSGDQFGVNFNWDYVLLQIRECVEDHSETRIKLKFNDVDDLIESLQYFQKKLRLWKEAVGHQRVDETEEQYYIRVYSVLRENNYFLPAQEA
jgi:hypothetical protein